MKRTSITLAVLAALATHALAQQPSGFQCPDDNLDKVRQYKPLPTLVGALVLPLYFLNELARDPLSDKPTREVSVRVVDEAGKAVSNALVALIYRTDKDKRFLAEGAAGGEPIKLPHGRYLVNAAIATKDRGVRYGSTEVRIDAKGPSTVTVKLTGRAAASSIKPASARALAGGRLSIDVTGALRERTVLAVMRRGGKVSGGLDSEPERPLSQRAVDSGPASVQVPSEAGSYDVVAMLCAPRVLLARAAVTATPARVVIEAPERASRGQVLRTTVSGTLSSSFSIAIGRAGEITSFGEGLSGVARQMFAYKLPREAGIYEITVSGGDYEVLARRTVNVDFTEIPISGPDKIQLGDTAAFSWPDQDGDKVRLELWTLARGGKPAKRVSEVREKRVVAGPGEYELRLLPWSRRSETPLGRKRLRVEGQAFAKAPAEAVAGTRVTVELTIKPQFFDRLWFSERGSTMPPHHIGRIDRQGNRMTIEAPKKPGTYDLVFMIGEVGGEAEAGRVPFEVHAQGWVPKPDTATGAISGQEKEQDACCSNPVGAAFDALKPASKGETAK
jgi:hypothetical protein